MSRAPPTRPAQRSSGGPGDRAGNDAGSTARSTAAGGSAGLRAHRAVSLLDAVGAHDVEDAHADVVAVAAAARQACQRQPRKQAAQRVVGGAGLQGDGGRRVCRQGVATREQQDAWGGPGGRVCQAPAPVLPHPRCHLAAARRQAAWHATSTMPPSPPTHPPCTPCAQPGASARAQCPCSGSCCCGTCSTGGTCGQVQVGKYSWAGRQRQRSSRPLPCHAPGAQWVSHSASQPAGQAAVPPTSPAGAWCSGAAR